MAAAACLQVVITTAVNASYGPDVLNTVAKVTNAYLESRWSWPRKFGAISKTAYLLADPHVAHLDPHEIKQLSAELQLRLFGVGEAGDVTLAMFEGSNNDSQRFAHLPMDDLRRLLGGAELNSVGLHGRLIKVSAHEVHVLNEAPYSTGVTSADPCSEPDAVLQMRLLYRGIYLAPKQQFIGSIVSRWSPEDARHQSILEGPSHFPVDPETFDRETLETLIRTFPDPSTTSCNFLLPTNYTALTRRSSGARYTAFLAPLAKWPPDRLTAAIYDAPRTVQPHALNEIRALLNPYFGGLNLCVADAGFEPAMIEPGALRSVTLMLSSAEEELQRESAIRRFMSNRDQFREKHIWPMIGNVRTRREMQVCAATKAPFLSGPAITGILTEPVGMTPFLFEGLPVNAKAT